MTYVSCMTLIHMIGSRNCDDDSCSKCTHSKNKLFYVKHKSQLTPPRTAEIFSVGGVWIFFWNDPVAIKYVMARSWQDLTR